MGDRLSGMHQSTEGSKNKNTCATVWCSSAHALATALPQPGLRANATNPRLSKQNTPGRKEHAHAMRVHLSSIDVSNLFGQ